jgi:hypothetical protein
MLSPGHRYARSLSRSEALNDLRVEQGLLYLLFKHVNLILLFSFSILLVLPSQHFALDSYHAQEK